MNMEEKQALLEKALEFKMLSDKFGKEYVAAKSALKRAVDTDGDSKVITENECIAYYKHTTSRKFKDVKVIQKIPFEAMVAILAGAKVTNAQVNILAKLAGGIKIDSLMLIGHGRSFTCELPKDEEKKQRIEDRIAVRAQEEIENVNRRVKSVGRISRPKAAKKKKARKKRVKKS